MGDRKETKVKENSKRFRFVLTPLSIVFSTIVGWWIYRRVRRFRQDRLEPAAA